MAADKKPTLAEVSERLYKLFKGNSRSVGRFNPVSSQVTTDSRESTVEDWEDHVRGKMGIGVVPIMDDGMCNWAALDIDCHGEEVDIPIVPLEQKVSHLQLPLVLCRSKSGGIHAFAFFKEPMPAVRVRVLMAGWSKTLGYDGCEIFPKQNKLHRQTSGQLSFGNWLNMPYLGGKETIRYGVHNGEKIGLVEFLDLADSRKTSEKQLAAAVTNQYHDAPPCICKVLSVGVGEGNRNEAIFNTVIYLKRAHPDDCSARAIELNPIIFHKALPKAELMRTIASASRPDYSYRCNEEPIRSHCDKTACLASRWGISAKEGDSLEVMQELPTFSKLVKYMTEPVRWEIHIGDSRVGNLSTPQLLDWRIMRELIAEKLMRVVPMIKPIEWDRVLSPLMAIARIVETPDDASISGVVRLRMREFAGKTDLANKGRNTDDRKALLRGLPCVQEIDGDRCVLFRGQDLINYLKRTKSEELKGTNLWFAVKEMGVEHRKIRAGDSIVNVWSIPVSVVTTDWQEAVAPVFTTEI